jgi:hypothetical protein
MRTSFQFFLVLTSDDAAMMSIVHDAAPLLSLHMLLVAIDIPSLRIHIISTTLLASHVSKTTKTFNKGRQ